MFSHLAPAPRGLDLWEHHRLSICASSAISACGRRSDWRRSLEIYEAFDREAPSPGRSRRRGRVEAADDH